MKRAKGDPEFRARVEASGAVLDGHFEAVLERVHKNQAMIAGPISCTEYWWGFQLSIPHARRAAHYVATRLAELRALDRGEGLQASMTWMAPKIFVPVAPR